MLSSRIRGCPACCLVPQHRRLLSNASFYDVLPVEVDLLIDNLFDQLDLYERALSRHACNLEQSSSFFRVQRPQRQLPQQFKQQRQPLQQQQQTRGGGFKSKNLSQGQQNLKTTCQQPKKFQQNFQGKFQQQKTTKLPLQQQQLKQNLPNVPSFNKANMQQKYRICVDCRCCDFDPCKVQKSLKCGANGLYHFTVCAPCISNPAKLFKRSYTLPSQVQHTKLSQSVTAQGHCLFEFPLMEEPATLAIADLMAPVQTIQTANGQKAFFVQVPILPIMDPAKVKVCIKDGAIVVKFEHKKTIGETCSRVFYCCQVPLPKCNNIDVSSILCKQNKHTLNITVPIKKGTSTKTTMCINKEIPVHRKLRWGTMSSTMTQQQQQKQQPISGGIQQKQQPKKPIQKSKSTSNEPVQKSTGITSQKKPQQLQQQQNVEGNKSPQQQYPKLGEGVSKGSELLAQVFGFSGGKSSSKQTQKQSSGTGKQSTKPSTLEKGRLSSSDVKGMQGEGNKSPQRSSSTPDEPSSSSNLPVIQ